LAEPIIATIWQRGRFDVHDTLATASALRGYALGLIFYSAIKILQPTFYSIDRKWVPMWVSVGAIILNALLNSVWIFWVAPGHEDLALSTTIGSFFNFLALYLMMLHYTKHLETGRLFRSLAKIGGEHRAYGHRLGLGNGPFPPTGGNKVSSSMQAVWPLPSAWRWRHIFG